MYTLSSLLSGCAIYEQAFDCEAGKGLGCKSISEVNGFVDRGELDSALEGKKPGCSDCAPLSSSSEYEELRERLPALPDSVADSLIEGAGAKRAGEETLRVWIAPFEDKDGDFQGESYVHTVITPGRWIPSDGESS